MINKLQTRFGVKATSGAETLYVDLRDYLKGPLSSFSAGLVQYLDINEITLPPFERFSIHIGNIEDKIYDVSYILKVLIPAQMAEFYYADEFWLGIDPALKYLKRVDNTFIPRDVSFSKRQLENTFKSSSHLSMLSFVYPKIELNGDFDFNIDTPYSIKFLEIAYNRKVNKIKFIKFISNICFKY